MREHLYQGKRIDNGEWVQGDLIHRQIWASSLCIIRVSDDGFDHYEEYEVDPETVSEFTGKCDKNGKRIFEGYILLYKTWLEEKILFVIFKDGAFGTQNQYDRCLGEFMAFSDTEYPYSCERDLEVVGNKWDNKELLKGE